MRRAKSQILACSLLLAIGLGCVSPAQEVTARPLNEVARRALLIGIDDYTASSLRTPGLAAGAEASKKTGRTAWPPLYGAVNDARAFREMLISRYAFPANNVEVLTDQDATRAAILQAQNSVTPCIENGRPC